MESVNPTESTNMTDNFLERADTAYMYAIAAIQSLPARLLADADAKTSLYFLAWRALSETDSEEHMAVEAAIVERTTGLEIDILSAMGVSESEAMRYSEDEPFRVFQNALDSARETLKAIPDDDMGVPLAELLKRKK